MNPSIVGNVLVFLSAVCLAISAVYTHVLLQDIDPLVFAFYCFAMVIAMAFVIRRLFCSERPLLGDLKANAGHVLLLNVTTAVDWVLYLVALKVIDGSFTNALVFGVTPIASLFFSRRQNAERLFFSILILVFLTLIGFEYINFESTRTENIVYGIVISVVAGIAVGGTTVSLKELSNRKFQIVDVILTRYVLTLVIAFAIILGRGTGFHVPAPELVKVLAISIVFVLLPTYLVQRGIRSISPFSTAVISSSIPALTFLFAAAASFRLQPLQMMYVFGLSVVLVFLTTRKERSPAPAAA